MRVALELVPTPIDMLGSNIPQGTVGYTRDGVSVEGHLWKAKCKEKPNDEGRKKLTM